MNKLRLVRGLQLSLALALTLMLGFGSVQADDTEVFFPQNASTLGTQNPNLLFMLDTSGSMACAQGITISSPNICAADTDPLPRIERLKSALIQVLDDLPSTINVGLGRFSGAEGGAILFPVSSIDANLSTITGNRILLDAYTSGLSGSEAEENETSPNNVTFANSLATPAVRVGALDPVTTFTPQAAITVAISSSANEAEQWSNGTMETGAASGAAGNRRCGIGSTNVSNVTTSTNAGVKGVFELIENAVTYVTSGTTAQNACAPQTAGTPGRQLIGLRFIPPASLTKTSGITTAQLQFTVHTQVSTSQIRQVNYRIRGEAADNSAVFTTAANNLGSRIFTTGSAGIRTGSISTGTNPAAGSTLTLTADVAPIIDLIRNRPGWNPGNPITLVIDDNGSTSTAQRRLHSFLTGGAGSAPTLIINRPNTTSTTIDTLNTGLRFENVQVPRGATIRSARLELRARGSQTLTPQINLNVTAEASDDSPQLALTAANISSRSKTPVPVTWSLPTTSLSDQDTVLSPDLKDVIQAVTGRTGWCGGNALTLSLDQQTLPVGVTTAARFSAYSNSEYVVIDSTSEAVVKDGPILHIELDATDTAVSGPAAGCANGRASSAVLSGGGDGEEQRSGGSIGSVNLADNDLELGFDINQQLVAVRFEDVRVPQGATILSASLDFTAVGASSGNAGLNISAISAGNTNPLTAGTNALSALTPKTGVVTWSTASGNLTDWADQTVYTTPDLTTVVQAVVNNGGWGEGNNMTFLVEANCPSGSCRRRAYSFNGRTSAAPRLKIRFSGSAIPLTVRDEIKRLVLDLPASGSTPTTPALYEAARYLRGEAAYYGRTRGNGPGPATTNARRQHRISHVKSFTAASGQTTPVRANATCQDFNPGAADCVDEHWIGTTNYETPIVNACSSNNLIFFTDGSPNVNNANTFVKTLIGKPSSYSCVANAQSSAGDCARDLVKYMYENDQSTSTVGRNLAGTQTITTHTVLLGFAAGSPQDTYVKQLASDGGGSSYLGNDASELATAFNAIVSSILDINTTFTAPAVTVNTFNRLTNRNELYFALFNPAAQVKWEGNLKKYKLGLVETAPSSGIFATRVVDTNNADAVDPATGFFRDTAQSIWSAAVDGRDVTQGGYVSRLTNSRSYYTYTGADLPPAATPTPFDLSTSALNPSNSSITNAMIGAPVTGNATTDAAARADVLNWARGIDVDDINSDNLTTDARRSLGDPLHSQPVLVSYRGTNDTNTANDDITIFYGDNEGSLHAVDSATGNEVFSFIPKELLRNLNNYRNNTGSYSNRPYGLDGPVTSLFIDRNGDLLPLNSDGTVQTTNGLEDSVTLYVGMRRGGRNYYSLDVTRRSNPRLRWVIYGGSGSYRELGETWSRAVVTRIVYKGAERTVLVFTGGYDNSQDGNPTLISDSQGRAVYIADAVTGERLWWASSNVSDSSDLPDLRLTDMRFSIPASPTVVDLDGDRLADRIYVADAGGQVFRFVLNATHAAAESASTLVTTGGRIAVLSGADNTAGVPNTAANARRFFASPDVAFIDQGSSNRYLAISLGSGFREKPNNTTIQDRFYVLRDPDERKGPVNALSIVESDLFDTTDNLIAEGTSTQRTTAQTALDSAKGFYIRLVNSAGSYIGEKVFTESLTLNGSVIFSSFTPNITTSACSTVAGQSRLYLISVFNGAPVLDLSSTARGACSGTACDKADRTITLAQQGLASAPAIIYTSSGDLDNDNDPNNTAVTNNNGNSPIICSGAECFPGLTSNQVSKIHWQKKSE